MVLMQYAARCRPGHAYEETIAYRGKNLLTGLKGTLLDAHISHHCTVHKYLVFSFQKVLLGRNASQMTITNIAYQILISLCFTWKPSGSRLKILRSHGIPCVKVPLTWSCLFSSLPPFFPLLPFCYVYTKSYFKLSLTVNYFLYL